MAMTSHKVDYSRCSIMLQVAAEAPAIRASETDRLKNSSWPSKTAFLGNFPAFSKDGRPWRDDDQNMDPMALVVLDDFSAEICRIDKLINQLRHLILTDYRLPITAFISTPKKVVILICGLLTHTTLSRTGIGRVQQKEPLVAWRQPGDRL